MTTTNKTKYPYINSRDEFFRVRVDISKIVYFESDGNYTNIILNNKVKGTLCMNLAQMQRYNKNGQKYDNETIKNV